MKIKTIKGSSVKDLVIHPAPDDNKYTRGKLTIVAGSRNYPGAACLASGAALRCGSGYVEVACDKHSLPIVRESNSNLVVRDWKKFSSAESGIDRASEGHPKACLIGSGFTHQDKIQRKLLREVLERAVCPVVVDGGAFYTLATSKGVQMAKQRTDRGQVLVLTPHYGEAARLASPLGIKVPENQFANLEDDAEFALSLSAGYGAIVVLKGSKTLIASKGHEGEPDKCFLMDKGRACLAKAGTGDVLAGMLSSFLSQGMNAFDAAKLATFTHAKAAFYAEKHLTDVCVCATDLIESLPLVFQAYES